MAKKPEQNCRFAPVNFGALKLLFPVVPDVLDVVVFFHDVDELFHQLIG